MYQKLNNLLGWITFGIATAVYFLTLEPTASWWDCGEYISTAFKLQVGHPPGAPTFQLLGRLFSLAAGGDTSQVALMINALSALSSSFTILFLFWTITMLARKVVAPKGDMTTGQMIAVFGSGLVGALVYTFSDSFWFSAVEGEVYAMSSFFTAVVFWAILKWELVADQKHSLRWLVLLSFLIGLSIGVHLLNLLAIPAIAFVYYYKKFTPSWKGIFVTAFLSILILAFIMYALIPDIVNLYSKTELFFVNSIGLPFNSGTIIFTLSIIAMLTTGIQYTSKPNANIKWFAIAGGFFLLMVLIGSSGAGSFLFRLMIAALVIVLVYRTHKGKHFLNAVLLSFLFLIIGYSSFLILVIRANANTPINENNPKDAVSLLPYLNREQYGDRPLFYGPYYNAPITDYEDNTPIYDHDEKSGKYVIIDQRRGTLPVYEKSMCTIFPRMYSNQKPSHVKSYENWGKIEGVPIQVTTRDGKTETLTKPTFSENLRFFFSYQIGHMYLRYFMWNFAGRQNDVEGHGGIQDGNWISGIKFLDEIRLGNLDKYPASWANPAHNKFYLLPLILGFIGFFYHLNRDSKDTFVVALLFLMTGLAIIIYLNQTPQQPRERDYAYSGSFYAFTIWIGLGVLGVYQGLQKLLKGSSGAVLATVLCLAVPAVMAEQGWDDHDRSHKYAARDFAFSYLDSCQDDAILFTNGDNDTFPLWYAQEVENHRTDIRVVNFMLASGDWYIHQMGKKVYDSDPMPLTLRPDQYTKGSNDILPVIELNSKGDYIPIKEIIKFVADERNRRDYGDGQLLSYIPTKRIRIPVDTVALKNSNLIPAEYKGKLVPYIDFNIKKNYLYKNDLMLLDIIATNNWSRPVYFTSPSAVSGSLDVDKYCHLEGMVYKFIPVKAENYIRGIGGVSTDTCYEKLVNVCKWGNLHDPRVTVDRESSRNTQIVRQNYMRVAQSLLMKGKKAEAIKALDTCLYYFPISKIRLDKYMIPFAEIYFAADDSVKGEQMTKALHAVFVEELTYFASLGSFRSQFEQEAGENLSLMSRLGQMAEVYNRKELADAINADLKRLSGGF